MDHTLRTATRQITREINRSGRSAPRIALILGLCQFTLLIGVFVKIWIISEGAVQGVWTISLLTAAYLLFTLLQVRGQITAMTTGPGIAGKRAYVAFIKKQRSKEGVTRLLAAGMALGAVSAVPELLAALQPATSWMEGSVLLAVFVTDAVRLYMTC